MLFEMSAVPEWLREDLVGAQSRSRLLVTGSSTGGTIQDLATAGTKLRQQR